MSADDRDSAVPPSTLEPEPDSLTSREILNHAKEKLSFHGLKAILRLPTHPNSLNKASRSHLLQDTKTVVPARSCAYALTPNDPRTLDLVPTVPSEPLDSLSASNSQFRVKLTIHCLGKIRDTDGRSYWKYDNGTFLPTEVDGKPVDLAWGVNKKGHPRARKPRACSTCRNRKVKCYQ